MKLQKNCIFEVLISTVNPDGSFNTAPMGVIRNNSKLIELRIFKTSTTYENLLENPYACISITDDPGLFFTSAFKETVTDGITKPILDEKMRVTQSSAHIFIEVNDVTDLSEIRSRFSCKVTGININPIIPQPFSRGRAEVIEAIIHSTRIDIFTKKRMRDDVERLIKRFTECKDIIERVSSPESIERKILRELEKMIAGWRNRL
jgi:hypothetical protein